MSAFTTMSAVGITSSIEWVEYFTKNLARPFEIPWERGAEISRHELSAIGTSLQGWQLGETSDGHHLRAAANRYARQTADPDYAVAVELFIREEQQHGATLGEFLDLAGIGRVEANWGDSLFRAARYYVTDMEIWTTPVVMVETLACVYYNAIRRATGSAVLGTICRRILADEVPHLRFQCERLALLLRNRTRIQLQLTLAAHRIGFLIVMLLVWLGHRQALRAGGYSWPRYWRAAWDRMENCWRLMDPRRYFPSMPL